MTRIIATLCVLLTILFLPYWIYLPLLFVAIILFPFYWEAVCLGFLIDVLYGSHMTGLLYPTALGSLAVLIVFLPLRERLRWQL